MDLLDLFRGKLSYPRAARHLVALLKTDSCISRAVKKSPLTQSEHLLIDVIDQLNMIRYLNVPVALSSVDKQARKKYIEGMPEPMPRPGEPVKTRRRRAVIAQSPRDVPRLLQAIMARAMIR